jgi:hypothetical protein
MSWMPRVEGIPTWERERGAVQQDPRRAGPIACVRQGKAWRLIGRDNVSPALL